MQVSLMELCNNGISIKSSRVFGVGGGGRFSSEIENLKGENHIAVPPLSHLPLIPLSAPRLVTPTLYIAITTQSPTPRPSFISPHQFAQFCAIKFGYIVIPLVSSKRPPLMPSGLNKLFCSFSLLFTFRFMPQTYTFCHLTELRGI